HDQVHEAVGVDPPDFEALVTAGEQIELVVAVNRNGAGQAQRARRDGYAQNVVCQEFLAATSHGRDDTVPHLADALVAVVRDVQDSLGVDGDRSWACQLRAYGSLVVAAITIARVGTRGSSHCPDGGRRWSRQAQYPYPRGEQRQDERRGEPRPRVNERPSWRRDHACGRAGRSGDLGCFVA